MLSGNPIAQSGCLHNQSSTASCAAVQVKLTSLAGLVLENTGCRASPRAVEPRPVGLIAM